MIVNIHHDMIAEQLEFAGGEVNDRVHVPIVKGTNHISVLHPDLFVDKKYYTAEFSAENLGGIVCVEVVDLQLDREDAGPIHIGGIWFGEDFVGPKQPVEGFRLLLHAGGASELYGLVNTDELITLDGLHAGHAQDFAAGCLRSLERVIKPYKHAALTG